MALRARGAAAKVLRGRPDDDFAAAGTADGALAITVEQGTTNQQMTAANDTVVRQANLGHQLMSKYVSVTLSKPYKGDPQATVVLTYGREDATPVGPDTYSDMGDGTNPVPASERLFSQGAGAAPRWKPGNWIHYHLRFAKGPLGKCACGQDPETEIGPECVMPGPVARHYFGDWDVVSYEVRAAATGVTLDSWLTRPWHRDRVATEHWGGYEMDFPASLQQIYDRNGALNVRALRRYGVPEIPDVTVTRLDTMMRRSAEHGRSHLGCIQVGRPTGEVAAHELLQREESAGGWSRPPGAHCERGGSGACGGTRGADAERQDGMSTANKNMIRQYKLEETKGSIAHPGGEHKDMIQYVMGPGSRMNQARWGDTFIKPPPCDSDVFGRDASNQGFRLRKPGK